MADETVSIQLLIDTSKSATNMAELEESIEAMREELRKTEIGSQEFDKLARSIQQAENKVKDIELTYESADLEGRFGRLGDVIGGVARGAAAVEGALFLMGEQGEEAEEVMAKLMSAMAIADSIEGFAKLGSALQKFTSITAITEKAQLALGVAIRASNRKEFIGSIRDMGKSLLGMSKSTNLAAIAKTALAGAIKAVRIAFTVLLGPIGWVIAGVTALGAVVYQFREQIEAAIRAIPGLSDALEWLGIISSEEDRIEQQRKKAHAANVKRITEEINNIKKVEKQVAKLKKEVGDRYDFEIKKAQAAGKNVADLEMEKLHALLAATKEQVRLIEQRYAKELQLANEITDYLNVSEALKTEIVKRRTGDTKKQLQEAKDEEIKLSQEIEVAVIADNKSKADAYREYAQTRKDIARQIRDLEISLIKDERERSVAEINEKYDRMLEDLANLKVTEDEKLRLIQLYNLKRLQELEQYKVNEDVILTEAEKRQAQSLHSSQELQNRYSQTILDNAKNRYETQVAFMEAEKEAQQNLNDAKIEMAQGLIGTLSGLAGENKKLANALFIIDKALAIGNIVVQTQREIAGYYANPAWSLMPDGGVTIKTTYATAAKIRAATSIASIVGSSIGKFMSGGGGGAAASSGGGGGVGLRGPNSPGQANMLPATGETVLRGNQMDTKVVVVESDITNVQSRVNVIENQAKVR